MPRHRAELARLCGRFAAENATLGYRFGEAPLIALGLPFGALMDGNQTHHQLLSDDVLADPVIRFDGGKLSPPTRPGLAIVLDEEKVEKYARLYEQDGQYFNFPVSGLHR